LIAVAVAEAVASLQARIAQLEAEVSRLKKNSGNSFKPPSSDIVNPSKADGAERRGKRSIGNQPGYAKHERKPFAPEEVDPRHPLSGRTAQYQRCTVGPESLGDAVDR